MKTKEDILQAVALDIFSLEQILDEFFHTNFVIEKGKNRHPNAEVLHEWIEYETMWYDDEGNIKWMTDHEADIQTRYLYEAKETKRIRG